MLCHLAALAMFIGIPFGNIVGPLVVWLIKREQYPFVNEQGREALNFQITMTIASLVAIPLVFIIIGVFLLIALFILNVVFIVLATVKANEGESYRYPFAIRFIK